jgi:oxygen-dependent protoporphyrinogen oxidase
VLERQVAALTELHRATAVVSLTAQGGRVRVRAADFTKDYDAVVVATEARSAGLMLGQLLGDSANTLRDATTLSSVNVSLVYPEAAVPNVRGSGFVVISKEELSGLRACSYSSFKLPGRAPRGFVLLRAFFRPQETEIWGNDDTTWVERSEHAMRRALNVAQPALLSRVARWQQALPVHSPLFREAVRALETPLNEHGVYLAGSAFHGSGIDAALRSADAAIRALCTQNVLFSPN